MKQYNLKEIPAYIQYFILLSSLVLTCYVCIFTSAIFNPLLAAFVIALLLKPFSAFLEKLNLSRLISSLLSLFLLFIIISGLLVFFSLQIGNITSDMDSLIGSFNILFDKMQYWTEHYFGIAPHEQIVYLKNSFISLLKNSTAFYKDTAYATAGFFSSFFIFIIGLFFFLYYRSFLVSFLYLNCQRSNHLKLTRILNNIQRVVKKYILGLALVVLTIAVLNTIGLLFLGIKHAIFFGILAALLTIIPYIGIILGSTLPILYAFATTQSIWYPVGILLLFLGVQLIEGNFITPNIMGNQVSINPFAAILGLLLAGLLLGMVGILFAIPLLAMIKTICDEIIPLRSLGYLIGKPPANCL